MLCCVNSIYRTRSIYLKASGTPWTARTRGKHVRLTSTNSFVNISPTRAASTERIYRTTEYTAVCILYLLTDTGEIIFYFSISSLKNLNFAALKTLVRRIVDSISSFDSRENKSTHYISTNLRSNELELPLIDRLVFVLLFYAQIEATRSRSAEAIASESKRRACNSESRYSYNAWS